MSTSDNRFDVAIVGLGTAGSYAYNLLNKAGFKVIAFDTKPYAGSRIRSTGAISSAWLDSVGLSQYNAPSLYDETNGVLGARLKGFNLYALNEKGHYSSFVYRSIVTDAVGYVFYQDKLERYLLGIPTTYLPTSIDPNIRFSHEVTNITITDKVEVKVVDKIRDRTYTITANNVLLCTGPTVRGSRSAMLAKAIGLYEDTPITDYVNGIEYLHLNNNDGLGNTFTLYFSKSMMPGGYFWIFPSKLYLKVGCGTLLHYSIRERFNNMRKMILDRKIGLDEESKEIISKEPIHLFGNIIPLAKPYKEIVRKKDGKAAILGDAANAVSAITGGGIQGALAQAYNAVDALTQGDLRKLQTWYKKYMYNGLMLSYRLKRWLYKLDDTELINLIHILNTYSEEINEGLDRIFMEKKIRQNNIIDIPPFEVFNPFIKVACNAAIELLPKIFYKQIVNVFRSK